MSYGSLVSSLSTISLSILWSLTAGRQTKALLPKSLRSKKKHERPSIAAIIEPSVSTAALFASATLVPSPSSYIFSQTPPIPTTEEEPTTLKETHSKRTLRRVKAKIELRATDSTTATAQMERSTTSTSTTTASSGSSHVHSTIASPVASPNTPTNSPVWDAEEDQTPSFGELFRRFSMQEAEELHTLLTSTERD